MDPRIIQAAAQAIDLINQRRSPVRAPQAVRAPMAVAAPPPAVRAARAAALLGAVKVAQQQQAQRVIQPAPGPVAPPAVRQLPRVGTGTAAAQMQAPQRQGPPSPGDMLAGAGGAIGGALGGITGAVGDKLGGGAALVAQSGPIEALGSTGAAQMFGSTLNTILTRPQEEVVTNFGEDAYRYLFDPEQAPGGYVVMENMPVTRGLFEWARNNPEKVKDAYEKGFTDRTGDESWTGGRAVWEAYSREALTGMSKESVLTGLLTDPLNVIPGFGQAGRAARNTGRALQLDAVESMARAATRSPGTDDAIKAFTQDLLSRDPERMRPILQEISPELARQVEAAPELLSAFPQGVESLARAAVEAQARRTAARAGQSGRRQAGEVLETLGTAVEVPARLLDELPELAVRGAGKAAMMMPGARQVRSRVGATLGRWAEASPGTKALQTLNEVLAARDMRRVAVERQRQLRATLGDELADVLLGPFPEGTPPTPAPPPTFADLTGATQRSLGSDAAEPVLGTARTTIPDPNGATPTTATATLDRPEAVVAGDQPQGIYREELQPARGGMPGPERARIRFNELKASAPPEIAEEVTRIYDDLVGVRDDILATTELAADKVRQRKINAAELWRAELHAEQAVRTRLREAGATASAHVNREAGRLAQALDTLAWNPSDEAAEKARKVLDAEEAKAETSEVQPVLRAAREDAEANRTSLTSQEPATMPATITAQEPPRPAAPTATAAARESLTLPPEANGYVEVPVAEIRTDPSRFQPRTQLSQEQVDRIAREFDWQDLDPLKLWRDPNDGNFYVIKGHHRLAAVQKRGDIEAVPAQIIGGTEDEAIARARTSNAERPESPLEKAQTVLREFDRTLKSHNIDPTDLDEIEESEFLAGLHLPNVATPARRTFLNLARLPATIRDNLAVHSNAGKAIVDAHAKLGSRIDAHARPRKGTLTVTPQEAEGLYRTFQKQKRKSPDDPLPDLEPTDINRVVDAIDAMTGMSRQEQMGMFAGMVTDDGRAGAYVATLSEMAKRNKELTSRLKKHSASMQALDREIEELNALDPDDARIPKKRTTLQALQDEVDEARINLEQAQHQGTRLAENQKRDYDYTEMRLGDQEGRQYGALFGPSLDDIRAAIHGGGEVARTVLDWTDETVTARRATDTDAGRTLRDEAAASPGVALPAIVPEEVTNVLGRQFTDKSERFKGRTYGEVADEIDARITADKATATRLALKASSTWDKADTKAFNALKRQYPGIKSVEDLVSVDGAKLLKQELREALRTDFDIREPTRIGRALDRASTAYSAINLLLPWTVPRYFLGNLAGDTWQVLLNDGPVAAMATNNVRHMGHLMNYALRGGDPLAGALGDTVKAAGLGGFHPRLITENLAESVLPSETRVIRRAAGRAKFNWIGDAAASGRNPVNVARNLVNGMEWAHRTGLWGHHFRRNVINAKVDYAREMTETALRHGVSGDEVLNLMDALPAIVDGAQVADSFARLATRRGRTTQDAAGFGEQMGRKWASRVYKANEDALGAVDESLFSYAQTNADAALRRLVPFHWWMSRAIPFYAEQMIRHPGFAAAYYRTWEATREQADAEGWPEALQMYTRLWEGPGGMMGMINPIASMSLLDIVMQETGGYEEENVSRIGEILGGAQNFGFGLLPWWSSALNYAGYLGDTPQGLDPVGTHQTSNFVRSMVQFAVGEGWLGEDAIGLVGRPFEEQMQRLRAVTSGVLPGSYHIDAADPNAYPQSQIRNIMLRNHLESLELTHDEYLVLGMRAMENPESPEAQQWEEINDAVAAEEIDAGPLYRDAVRDWSRSNVIGTAVNAVIPGPKRVRQEEQLATQALSRALGLPVREGSGVSVVLGGGLGPVPASVSGTGFDATLEIDTEDAEFQRQWQERFGESYNEGDIENMRQAAAEANQQGSANPEVIPLVGQEAAYYALGSEDARRDLEAFYAIANGERGAKLKDGSVVLSAAGVAALSEEDRWDLAEAWLYERDWDDEAKRLRDVRKLYEETHPEFGAFKQWSRDVPKQWGERRAFRVAAQRENENFNRFIENEANKARAEGLSANEVLEKLDQRAFSLDGYLAYQGIKKSRYDPEPLETGVPLPLASEGAPLGAMGGGEGGGYGGGQSWEDRVRTAIAETDAALRIANEFAGGNLMQVPAELRNAYFASPDFPKEGLPPEDAWIYEDYIEFYTMLDGRGATIEAFIDWTNEQYRDDDVPQGNVPEYQPGVWPPVAIAG